MSFSEFSIFCSGGHFILQSAAVSALLIEGLIRNIRIWPSSLKGYVV